MFFWESFWTVVQRYGIGAAWEQFMAIQELDILENVKDDVVDLPQQDEVMLDQ